MCGQIHYLTVRLDHSARADIRTSLLTGKNGMIFDLPIGKLSFSVIKAILWGEKFTNHELTIGSEELFSLNMNTSNQHRSTFIL